MRNHLRPLCFGLIVLGACGGTEPDLKSGGVPAPQATTAAPAAPGPSAAPAAGASDQEKVVKVDADTPMTTASGSTFIAPKGWTVTTKKDSVVLQDPNREVSVTFVERSEKDGAAAITAAWKQVQPSFARTVEVTSPWPGRNGWDARLEISYETAVAESRWVWANALRKGDTWFVMLSDGTRDGWGRRGPQARIARDSFRAKGVVEESFRDKKAHVLDEARIKKLEAFIEEGRQSAKIPGLAVAIVQGGKVVLEKGFGVKELGKKDPVTPNTRFRIASITKPLTSLMIAALVDEGKFTWDTRVTELLPTFAVGDAELTKRMTMRNILCACTGMPYDNVGTMFEYAGLSAEKMVERMKDLKPTTGFGETFQYSNAMIAAGGYAAAHAIDPKKPMSAAYEKAMQDRVFGPLGMKATTFDPRAVARGDRASPHNRDAKFGIVLTPSDTSAWITPMNPGGGAWSTVGDLSKVLLMELARGKTPEGKQVVSEKQLMARREPQARAGEKNSYGLALGVETYRDVRVYGHSGGLPGYTSVMFFLPDHDIAAVMLTNVGFPNPFVYQQFRRKLFEVLFDGREEAREDLAAALKSEEDWQLKDSSKIDFAPDRAFLDRFVGTYEHPLYGKLTIRIEGKGGVLDAGEWKSAVGRKKEEDGTEKLATTTPPWLGWPDFVPKETGGKLTLELEDSQRKVVFERVKGGK